MRELESPQPDPTPELAFEVAVEPYPFGYPAEIGRDFEDQFGLGADRIGGCVERPGRPAVDCALPGGEQEVARATEEVAVSDVVEQGVDCVAEREAGQVAQLRSADSSAIERLLGDKRAERFGPAFLDVLRDAG